MQKILITGGTGTLGKKLTPLLLEAGFTVRILSRGPRKESFPAEVEWAEASIGTGEGLAEAVAGVDTIIHAASTPVGSAKIDTEGARKLLELGVKAGVSHFLYISIVGVDRHPFAYYKTKYATEKVVENGGVPWSILRATQFHELLDEVFLPPLFKLPFLAFVPTDFQFQLIDTGEVAARMVEVVEAGPSGRVEDIGGPEVLKMGDLSRKWVAAKRMNHKIVHIPAPGGTARGFRSGENTCPDKKYGRITWADYLQSKYR